MDEKGWLIENETSEPCSPLYLTATSGVGLAWTREHHEAVRFARRMDAQRFASHVFPAHCHRVAEHSWG